MTPFQLYERVALEFPPVWPRRPEWKWVNVHDGMTPKLDAISDLLESSINSSEVVVIVHSEPGIAAVLSKTSAVGYIAQHVIQYEIQASDPLFTCFVAVSRAGVGTGWKEVSRNAVPSRFPDDA